MYMDYYTFLKNIFSLCLPLAITAVAIAVTVILIRRDRYLRKLSLEHSREEREIRQLAESGTISEEESRKLLASFNALPEVTETAPLPDIHLKLVSAFGRIFSVVKLALFFGNLASFVVILLVMEHREAGKSSFSLVSQNLWLLLVIWAAVLALSVLEFIASIRLLRGSRSSRKFLTVNWLVNIALLHLTMIWFNPVFYVPPVLICGLYSLCILTRKAGKGIRAAIAAAGLLAVWFGVFASAGTYTQIIDHDQIFSGSGCSSSSTAHSFRYSDILLIQGTPDEETRMLCRLLAEEINRSSSFPCRVQYAGAEPVASDYYRTLPLLVMRGIEEAPQPLLQDTPEEILRLLADQVPEIAAQFQKDEPLRQFQKEMKNPLVFHIRSAYGYHKTSFNFRGLRISESAPAFGASFLAGTASGKAERTLAKLIPQVRKDMNTFFAALEKPQARLPEIQLPAMPESDFHPDFIEQPELLYRGHALLCRSILVWRFELKDADTQEKQFTEALEKLGFAPDENRYMDGTWQFQRKHEEIYLSFNYSRQSGTASRYGLLTYVYRAYTVKQTCPEAEQEAFLKKVLEDDPRSFLLLGGQQRLRGEVLSNGFDRLLTLRPLGYLERKALWQSTDNEEAVNLLGERRVKLFYEMAGEVLATPFADTYVDHLKDLFGFCKTRKAEKDFLISKLPGVYSAAAMPETPGEDGYHSWEAEFIRDPFLPSLLIADLTLPTGKRIPVFASLFQVQSGEYQIDHINGWSRYSEFPRELTQTTYLTDDGGFYLSHGGEIRKEDIKPGTLAVSTVLVPDRKCYQVKVIYNPRSQDQP